MTGVIEQRFTATVIFILIGCSIFITDYLQVLKFYWDKPFTGKKRFLVTIHFSCKLIPMPVLYAIFMYMGVTPMSELDLYKRCLLIFMPKKHQPDYVFARYVRLYRMHLFTFIQLVCLGILYALKMNKKISITFPMMVSIVRSLVNNIKFIWSERNFLPR